VCTNWVISRVYRPIASSHGEVELRQHVELTHAEFDADSLTTLSIFPYSFMHRSDLMAALAHRQPLFARERNHEGRST